MTNEEKPNRYMKLEELVKFLPKDRQPEVIRLAYSASGLIEGAGFVGMIYGFWGDCVRGEIINYLRRTDKLKDDNSYCNSISDFYIDARCGKAPRKEIREYQNKLKLAIGDDLKPCAICETATRKTAQQQHKEQQAAIVKANEVRIKEGESPNSLWNLSDKKLANRNLTKDSYVCYLCYQNKLATIPKEATSQKQW